MTAIVEEDRARVHPAEGAHTGAPLGLGGALGTGGFGTGGFGAGSRDADVVILGYD
ncbi:hypothetical protein [Leifsonia sp. EB34]|uniref:hypothetical protein n=1 Tax=Leifsonia sp. EB34 TaxID=3156303 RepID=UPI003519D1E9